MGTLVGGVDRSTSKIEIIDDTFVVASSSLYFTLPYNTAFWYFNSWFRVEQGREQQIEWEERVKFGPSVEVPTNYTELTVAIMSITVGMQ